jgi:hypothetical protein
MNPHVKENMRYSSNETTEIDRLDRISDFFGKKPEEPINTKDGFIEPSLGDINHQAQYNWIDC